MIDPTDIHALSDFQRNAKKHLARLKKTGRPEVLTVNGKPAAVVQDPEAYKRFCEYVFGTPDSVVIRQSLSDFAAGRARPLKEVVAELRDRHGLKGSSASNPKSRKARSSHRVNP